MSFSKKIIAALLLAFVLVSGLFAQAQSFYIPSGSSVRNTGGQNTHLV